jgi:hypothetical protein
VEIAKELLRVFFVVGIVTIPILYWSFGRRSVERDQSRARKEDERVKHEHPSKEHDTSTKATD